MDSHVLPAGEDEQHVECPTCWCTPFEQARVSPRGRIEWVWVHEPGRGRRRRHKAA